ncbi:MAG: hypothetical protein K0Q72_4929, partial [Armatimonadetes bacterium]|nr:hypothetical protein [Armatimonadota bacterium]
MVALAGWYSSSTSRSQSRRAAESNGSAASKSALSLGRWYLNTPDLYGERAEDSFPNGSRMTGEYYIGDECYETHVGPVWFQLGVTCRCLKEPWYEHQHP